MDYQGGGFGGPKEMFKAICAECNTECEVPFRPTGDRPIYCQDCFSKRKEGAAAPARAREEHGHSGRKKPLFRKRSRERA